MSCSGPLPYGNTMTHGSSGFLPCPHRLSYPRGRSIGSCRACSGDCSRYPSDVPVSFHSLLLSFSLSACFKELFCFNVSRETLMLKTPCCIGVPGFCPFGWVWFAYGGRSTVPYFLARALVCPCSCFGMSLLVLRIPLLVLRISYLISCPELAEALAKIVNLKHIRTMTGEYFSLPSCISFGVILPF